eukprot:352471-Chlamydomonas_euryale.AAC.3
MTRGCVCASIAARHRPAWAGELTCLRCAPASHTFHPHTLRPHLAIRPGAQACALHVCKAQPRAAVHSGHE